MFETQKNQSNIRLRKKDNRKEIRDDKKKTKANGGSRGVGKERMDQTVL